MMEDTYITEEQYHFAYQSYSQIAFMDKITFLENRCLFHAYQVNFKYY